MPTETVQPTTDKAEPYQVIADELRHIASDLEKLIGSGLSMPWFMIGIQPATGRRGHDQDVVAAVDAVAIALLGRPASGKRLSTSYMHIIEGKRGPVEVNVYQSVSDPEERERDAELARLRAEVAELKTKAPVDFDRSTIEADGSEQVPAYVEAHANGERTGELTEVHHAEATAGPFRLKLRCPTCRQETYVRVETPGDESKVLDEVDQNHHHGTHGRATVERREEI